MTSKTDIQIGEELSSRKAIVRHFKGKYYQCLDCVKSSESEDYFMLYKALYGDFASFVRPISMFLSNVDKEKYPDIKQEKRFQPIDNSFLTQELLDKNILSNTETLTFLASVETKTNEMLKAINEFNETKNNHIRKILIDKIADVEIALHDLKQLLELNDEVEKEINSKIKKSIDLH